MSSDFEQCRNSIRKVLHTDSHIRYVVDALKRIEEKKIDEDTFLCISGTEYTSSSSASSILARDYDTLPLAGYLWKDCTIGKKGQIFINYDLLSTDKKYLKSTMLHELIHAYDDMRAYVNPQNCIHQACSEIRAAKLSGECAWSNEWRNFRLNPFSSGIRCVTRHAISSVSQNPFCKGEWAVDSMMPKCYRDYAPFVAPPYSGKYVYRD